MLAQKFISRGYFLWVLPLLVMVMPFASASPVAAATGAYVFDTRANVSVSDLTLAPPNPCYQDIQLSGEFLIQAHIVYPPEPVVPTGTIIILHLDATGISAVRLSDGALYQGTQGTSQTFFYTTSSMVFDAAFELIPSDPNQHPPNPCGPIPLTFQVQLLNTGEGGYNLSVSIMPTP